MEKEKQDLIKTAKKLYGEIKPCSHYQSFQDCFTFDQDYLFLWFNDITDSTKVLKKPLNLNNNVLINSGNGP